MRIAFDARPLLGPRTGVGVWLEGLLRGLVADDGLALPALSAAPRWPGSVSTTWDDG